MELIKTEIIGKCPNCNCTYMMIDNELVFCPGCALSTINEYSLAYEEEDPRKEKVQYRT